MFQTVKQMGIPAPQAVLAGVLILSSLSGCSVIKSVQEQELALKSLRAEMQAQREELGSVKNLVSDMDSDLDQQNQQVLQSITAVNQDVVKGSAKVADELSKLQKVTTDAVIEPLKNAKVENPSAPVIMDRVNGKMVIGEVESVYLFGPGFVFDARIDSGAETSSLDARNVTPFERDGITWVRFDVPVPGEVGVFKTLERKLVRRVRVRQSAADETERRSIVELEFAIGDHKQKAEFNLSDRDQLDYPILVGRNILRDVMIVDVGRDHVTNLPKSISDSNKE